MQHPRIVVCHSRYRVLRRMLNMSGRAKRGRFSTKGHPGRQPPSASLAQLPSKRPASWAGMSCFASAGSLRLADLFRAVGQPPPAVPQTFRIPASGPGCATSGAGTKWRCCHDGMDGLAGNRAWGQEARWTQCQEVLNSRRVVFQGSWIWDMKLCSLKPFITTDFCSF